MESTWAGDRKADVEILNAVTHGEMDGNSTSIWRRSQKLLITDRATETPPLLPHFLPRVFSDLMGLPTNKHNHHLLFDQRLHTALPRSHLQGEVCYC